MFPLPRLARCHQRQYIKLCRILRPATCSGTGIRQHMLFLPLLLSLMLLLLLFVLVLLLLVLLLLMLQLLNKFTMSLLLLLYCSC